MSNQDSLKNSILLAESKNYFWKGKGALSIKTFCKGRAYYQAGGGHFAVEEGSYLLLNQGQDYSITIESDVPVESFCIFFPDWIVEEAYCRLLSSDEQLLDHPGVIRQRPVDFVEKTYNADWLARTIALLKNGYQQGKLDSIWLEEQFHELANGLFRVHRLVKKEESRLHSLRAATREELFKRIHIGHEYLAAYFNHPVSLTEAANAACLSTNHFLRSYKQLFGITPHQYLMERRLQEAKKLLSQSDMSVTDICLEVGFQSPSSFSRLFSKRFGAAPSQYLKKVILDK